MLEVKKLNNPFVGLVDKPQASLTDYSNSPDFESITIVDVPVKVGDGESDYVIEKREKVLSRCKRQDYINSFAEDVGILNIMKKVSQTGDISLLNQRPVAGSDFVDISNLPDNVIDGIKFMNSAKDSFDSLPADLKKDLKIEDVANGKLDISALNAYIDRLVAAKVAAAEGDK